MARPPRIHVVGSSPRSGTTLLFELLCACFDIEKFGDHEVSLFEAPPNPAGPYASKKPTDFIHVTRVMRWDPSLHVIYMQRDPRDVVVSEHGTQKGEYWCDFLIWKRNQDLLPRLAGHPRFYECRYEDLVTDPDAEQARIVGAFTFLRQIHRFSEFDKVSQSSEAAQFALKGVRKISPKSVGSWKANLPRIAAQLEEYPAMAAAVVEAGYADDEGWADACAGVEPDKRESVRGRNRALRGLSGRKLALARYRRRLGTFWDELLYALGHRRRSR